MVTKVDANYAKYFAQRHSNMLSNLFVPTRYVVWHEKSGIGMKNFYIFYSISNGSNISQCSYFYIKLSDFVKKFPENSKDRRNTIAIPIHPHQRSCRNYTSRASNAIVHCRFSLSKVAVYTRNRREKLVER